MHVPFLDLKAQYRPIRDEIRAVVDDVLDTSIYVNGPYIRNFEAAFAAAHDAKHCVAVSNGTAALHIAMWALGLKAGDEVVVPTNTFIATAEGVCLTGATPVFVDHDEYYNLDPKAVENAITPSTRAIIAVHLYGQPAQMDALAEIAKRHNVLLIEDAAQAHLSRYQGKSIGAWGIATCFSFYPGKNLGAYGEAGAVITNDDELASQMRLIRDHGSETKYHHIISGHNYRLEALQGAVLGVKMKYIRGWTEARQRAALRYCASLSDVKQLALPNILPGAEPVWHLFVVAAERRDGLKAYLAERQIDTGLHYPVPLHQQEAFRHLHHTADFANAERLAPLLLSLPMYPELTDEQIDFVCESIREFYRD